MRVGRATLGLLLIAASAGVATGAERSVADLVRESAPQIVRIRIGAAGAPPAKPSARVEQCRHEPRGVGTGFVIAIRPSRVESPLFTGAKRSITTPIYILTNNHVANPCAVDWPQVKLRVQFAGEGPDFDAVRVGADAASDLAVIRVERLRSMAMLDNHPLRFATGVSTGEDVVAIGFALGQEGGPSVSKGIVSAVGRSLEGRFSDLIQMDASIHGGNSGGPLLNLRGEVVGVNTAGFNETVNFAISARVAARVAAELVARGAVTRGQLGVRSVVSVTDDVVERRGAGDGPALERGALIVELTPGTALARAGLRRCDLIQQVDAYPIRNLGDLTNALLFLSPGATVSVRYRRYPPTVCEPARLGGSLSARLVRLSGPATTHSVSVVLGGPRTVTPPTPR